MSNTRTAKPGGPIKQERWASSPVYERGLMANLVAKRVSVIESADARALIWFLQFLSWQRGGLSAAPVPSLERWCLDPESELAPADLAALCAFRADWIKARVAGYVETSVGCRIAEALDYTRSARTISIIDGASRLGKTFAVRQYCQASAGLARYVQVPSSSDEISFLRAIAASLGLSIHLGGKAVDMRARIEEVLHTGDLMLVLDEAAYLYSQTWQRYSQPARVNWIMTALANFGVSVALVSCPHFYNAQTRTEKLTGWNSAQFIGRIGHVERLPDKLTISDLLAVARAMLPGADARAHAPLASYAAVSKKHLASIEAVVKRARWLAERQGRGEPTVADVQTALKEAVIPGDAALEVSLRQTRRAGYAAPSPAPREAHENTFRRAVTSTAHPVRDCHD